MPELGRSPLGEYLADSASLRRAIDTWHGARRHFVVSLAPRGDRAAARRQARLAAGGRSGPTGGRDARAGRTRATRSPSWRCRSIPPATRSRSSTPIPRPELFLDATSPAPGGAGPARAVPPALPGGAVRGRARAARRQRRLCPAAGLGHLREGCLSRPAGRLGPRSEPAAARPRHTCRAAAPGPAARPGIDPGGRRPPGARSRRCAPRGSSTASSGATGSRAAACCPTRYGTSSDVQLWSSTDLAVQFVLSRLPHP